MRLKVIEIMLRQNVGEFLTGIWFAIMPSPLDPILVQDMANNGRSGEVAILGDKYYWIMGRVINPDYSSPYTMSDAVAREVNDKMPDLRSREEYRFKVIK